MSGAVVPPGSSLRRGNLRAGVDAGVLAAARGAVLFGLMLAGTALLLVLVAAAALIALGLGTLILGSRFPIGERMIFALAVLAAVAGLCRFLSRDVLPGMRQLAARSGRSLIPLAVIAMLILLIIGDGANKGSKPALALIVISAGLLAGRYLTVPILLAVRRLARLTRRLSGQWCGVPIPEPAQPPPGPDHETIASWARLIRLLSDRVTGRALLWTVVNGCAGWVLAAVPAGLAGFGLIGLIGPVADHAIAIPPPAFPGNTQPVLVLMGVAATAFGVATAPWLLRGYGGLARLILAPAGQAELEQRVLHLAQTRSETIDSGAAEIRRIERDLHDGAQARLVAMGMMLDAAGQLIRTSPDAADALLSEARESSVKALAELRALVRGVHPPVLADRGLADAIRALALDSPVRARVASELSGRPPAPVESAAYFAVSELLANVSKHAYASQAWIDIRHSAGMLRVGVTDDGRGGASPEGGTGLRGIERRLAAFDGVLAVSSPPGGPTAVTMELPCELSSPKTSSC